MLKGWDLRLKGMRVSGKRKLVISPKQAHGAGRRKRGGTGGGEQEGQAAACVPDISLCVCVCIYLLAHQMFMVYGLRLDEIYMFVRCTQNMLKL